MLNQDLLGELAPAFYPRSIAVVGAAQGGQKVGTRAVIALTEVGFEGRVYPVHPGGGEINGLKVYPSVRAIPEPVDLVTVFVPASSLFEVLDDCAARRVRVVQMFTGGFSEANGEEGRRQEREMAGKARQGGFRIIGPNCMGICCPRGKVPFAHLGMIGTEGAVSVLSQSGGIAQESMEAGARQGFGVAKVVSYGNGCDLDSVDFLEYFALDPETRVIGAYLEGVRDGRRLVEVAREAARIKPVVIWKGGKTEVGARAAASHTGSLAGAGAVWSAALKQAGVVEVQSLEEMADTLLAFQDLPPMASRRVGVVAGLALGAGGGGMSVHSGDMCISQGLEVPLLAEETRQQLLSLAGRIGTIIGNPLDLGAFVGFTGSPEMLRKGFELVMADPGNDVIITDIQLNSYANVLPLETVEGITDMLAELRKDHSKPLVAVSHLGVAERARLQGERKLSDAGIPAYPTWARAARAIFNVSSYWRTRSSLS